MAEPHLAPNAARFEPLPADRLARWSNFGSWDQVYFPTLVGLRLEELRTDYARMRMVWRPELDQTMGLVHGGAIATLIDTVVVPAIGSGYESETAFSTVSMTVQYRRALRGDDAVAEGWVEQRGRTVVFSAASVRAASTGAVVATGTLVFSVRATL